MSKTTDMGALSIESSWETSRMVGLDFGLVAKHANASFAIDTTFNVT